MHACCCFYYVKTKEAQDCFPKGNHAFQIFCSMRRQKAYTAFFKSKIYCALLVPSPRHKLAQLSCARLCLRATKSKILTTTLFYVVKLRISLWLTFALEMSTKINKSDRKNTVKLFKPFCKKRFTILLNKKI